MQIVSASQQTANVFLQKHARISSTCALLHVMRNVKMEDMFISIFFLTRVS